MPAKWPLFIDNLSTKLSARDADTRPEFAKEFAKQYLDAVDTAQTPFGNLHKQSGQKVILDEGFTLAFEALFNAMPPDFAGDATLEDKKTDEKYVDLIEPLPSPDLPYDPLCEIEKWTEENKDDLDKFNFYPFFTSTCPVPSDADELTADFNFKLLTDITEEASSEIPNQIIVFYLINFNTSQSYNIQYELNGIIQPLSITDADGRVSVPVPSSIGKYTYKFLNIMSGDGNRIIKEINKTRTITIGQEGQLESLDSIDSEMGINIDQVEILEQEKRQFIPDMNDAERADYIAQRVSYQNDGSEAFTRWVKRLHKGYDSDLGKQVKSIWLSKYSTDVYASNSTENTDTLEVPLNQYVFQEEHADHEESIPEWLTARLMAKFVYIKHIDGFKNKPVQTYVKKITSFEEKKRIKVKVKIYEREAKRYRELQRSWVKSQEEKYKKEQEEANDTDPYDIMAGAIIAYWISSLAQPFKKSPPIPPCNIPSPGIYIPIYYGSRKMLANDLRRAWNMGKIFNFLPATPIASKLVAAAVAVACAKHLLMLKFIYVGQLSTPAGPIPMIGFVPVVF